MLSFSPLRSFLVSESDQKLYKYCKNNGNEVCNWILEASDFKEFSSACQLNRTIPNLSSSENFSRWKSIEITKHRLIYQL